MSEFSLTTTEKKVLLGLSRDSLTTYLKSKKVISIDRNTISENLKTNAGAFVSIHKNEQLRGCIGRFGEDESLYSVVIQMAIASGTQDHRFPSVKLNELEEISFEISVLTPMKKIINTDEITLGKHGIYIVKGYNAGTFLPQVAKDTGWNLSEFLGHCSRDKAGIGWDGWKTADIFTYEAIVFSESDPGINL